jgi:hypothetical protein
MTIDSKTTPAGQKNVKQELLPKNLNGPLRDQGIDRIVSVKGTLTLKVNTSSFCPNCTNPPEFCQQCIMESLITEITGGFPIISHTLEVTPTNYVKSND